MLAWAPGEISLSVPHPRPGLVMVQNVEGKRRRLAISTLVRSHNRWLRGRGQAGRWSWCCRRRRIQEAEERARGSLDDDAVDSARLALRAQTRTFAQLADVDDGGRGPLDQELKRDHGVPHPLGGMVGDTGFEPVTSRM
jgi:hypothetical protein